jgi:aryl-alcohol dehydrogenase-like predicted oxidoreductase
MIRRAELGLGTAQFGMDAAFGGSPARVREGEVRAILDAAADAGLSLIDTGPRYGDGERVLGQCWPFPSPFKVVVKTIPLAEGLDRVEARARRSLERMGLPRGHALLVERAEDLMGPDARLLWARLEKLRDEGLFHKIGVSVGGGDEPVHLARRFQPDLIQIPCSMLDQRPAREGVLAALRDLGVEVQLRSIFLQGLLFLPREALPHVLADAGPRLSRIRRMLAEAGADPLQAALAYALSRPEASAVMVGVTSAAELRALMAAAAAPAPELDWSELALDHPVALDPRLWASPADVLSSAA